MPRDRRAAGLAGRGRRSSGRSAAGRARGRPARRSASAGRPTTLAPNVSRSCGNAGRYMSNESGPRAAIAPRITTRRAPVRTIGTRRAAACATARSTPAAAGRRRTAASPCASTRHRRCAPGSASARRGSERACRGNGRRPARSARPRAPSRRRGMTWTVAVSPSTSIRGSMRRCLCQSSGARVCRLMNARSSSRPLMTRFGWCESRARTSKTPSSVKQSTQASSSP